ncbi:MAG TPA: hypothetical protein ENI02_03010, partial [Candidatus Aminicenantes bacterium]|nr:hypothetical protein [Candidatus Aminicenantes bacterium]
MVLKFSPYQYAKRILKDKKFAISRNQMLLRRIQTRIELINIFLGEEDIQDKDVKSRISLLSSLLDVKRKLKVELRELSQDFG